MTPEQTKLVQETFSLLATDAEKVATAFYSRLFEIEPNLKSLFKGDMESQKIKFMSTLQMIVTSLDKPEVIIGDIENMAVRHVYYGVKDEHYDTVGAALLDTLKGGLAENFTPEVRDAWSAAYKMLSDIMIKAAKEA